MQKVEFVPLMLTDKSDIYSIRINDDKETELHKFIVLFKDSADAYLNDDFDRILAAIEKIAQNGALESFFRIEGKMNDRVCAIPLLIKPRNKKKHGTLRLYCVRVSETLLIVGGGGLKVTDTYEDNSLLLEHVSRLQAIDSQLSSLEKGELKLEDNIMNITILID